MARTAACPTCGHMTSENAEHCPSCGEPLGKNWIARARVEEDNRQYKPKPDTSPPPAKEKGSRTNKLFLIIAGLLVLGYFVVGNDEADDPQALAEKAAAEAENKRKGFHCLSAWDGSHSEVKGYVEERVRDPDSFEHIETRITPVSNGEHTLVMKYRAKNGFGGMTVGEAVATIRNSDCRATVLSVQ